VVNTTYLTRSIALLLVVHTLCTLRAASAQPVRGGGPGQTITAGYYNVDFEHSGDSNPAVRYDYTRSAFGVAYTNPFLSFGLMYGPPAGADTAQVRLLDVSLGTQGSLNLSRKNEAARVRLFVPLGLSGGYRRIRRATSAGRTDQFDMTVLALTGGMGARARMSKKAGLELRVAPGAGLATRSFGDATGLAYQLDADARLTLAQVAGRYGLHVGYGFRFQGWNMRLSSVLRSTLPGDIYDYRTRQHGFRVGVAF